MIAEKDASKSDERHVKDRRNTNLLTQKKTGGKDIMGNRGMTNWKLGAFFIISLMLVAAVFSNTAMAAVNDGKGMVTVTTDPTDAAGTDPAPTAVADPTGTDPLAAGSKFNALRFTYTAWEDKAGGTDDSADAGEEIDMAGGRVRIAFPSGWMVSNKLVTVVDGATSGDAALGPNDDGVIYSTDAMGKLLTAFASGEGKTAADRVSLSDSSITINLGREWGRGRADVERLLIITFSDVQAGLATDAINFPSSSSARGGNLRLLAPAANQPSVTVGNILGVNLAEAVTTPVTPDTTPSDPLSRDVAVKPATVYPGQKNVQFEITFTAPGPMDVVDLVLTLPSGLTPTEPAPTTDNINMSGGIRVVGRGGAVIGTVAVSGGELTIPLTKITKGQKVVVSYRMDVPTSATGVVQEVMTSPFEATTGGTDVTKITGGIIREAAGSGKMEIKPISIENGLTSRTFTLTYTAYTMVTGDIAITPAGIVLEDDPATQNIDEGQLQMTTSGGYGYVKGSVSPSGNRMGTLDVANNVITFQGVSLAKDAKLTTTVSKVHVTEDAGNYDWMTTVATTEITNDTTTADVNEVATLTVVDTEQDAVQFSVVGDGMYHAASKTSILFRFTADTTPIRDGNVSFRVPAALGSAPQPSDAEDKAGTVDVSIDGGMLKGAKKKDQIKVSGSTITVHIERLNVSGSVTVTYGKGTGKSATVVGAKAGDVKVIGNYKTATGTRPAGTATVKILNVMDGAAGTVTISPKQVEAGSNHGVVMVKFTALGTMDTGHVSLELPSGWGPFERDPVQRNYIQITGNSNVSLDEPAIGESSSKAVAGITKLAAGQSFTFVYGRGSSGNANGAEVQDDIGVATFTIESDGDGDDLFAAVLSTKEQNDTEKAANPDALGQIFMGADGQLKVEVEAAADGTGTAVVDPMTVRSAANDVKLKFTYTSTQTIQDGDLRFNVPSGWSAPQVSDAGEPGYTVVGGSGLGTAEVPSGKRYITVPIAAITKGETITITYGDADDGRAMAPTTVGPDTFTIAVRGTSDGALKPLSSGSPIVTVQPQASGVAKAATAMVSDGQGMLYAGQDGREITVVYTAAGQIVAGAVRLTLPAKVTTSDGLGWSAPTADNVTVTASTGGSVGTPEYGGSLATPTQVVTVDGVNLMSGGTLTFVYTGKVQPTAKTGVKFKLETDGDGVTATVDAFKEVETGETLTSVMLTVDVGEAKKGSGTAEIADADTVVAPGATGETITFTYTAVGEISYPKEFRVRVPLGWSKPTNAATSPDSVGTYSVEHINAAGLSQGNRIVEEIDPVDRDMRARVKSGLLHVMAGDQIIITYENATAPATAGATPFGVYFGGQTNDAQVESINVFVQSAMPSQLALSSGGTVSADAGAAPLAVTVSLQDAAGMAAAMAGSAAVTLMSSSATGAFSVTADGTGTASAIVNIAAGMTTAMAYYSDSTVGTATITASAAGLTSATQMVTVTTGVIAITPGSVMVSPALAKAGDMVTVSVMGTPGQTAMFSVGAIVTDKGMPEAPAGSYSGMFEVIKNQHVDGTYGVTVSLGTASGMGSLTIDTTDPVVTVTAPESAEDGDTVMISAMVTEAGTVSSVKADVSMLDSTQAVMVDLTMAADGSYSVSHPISDDNAAVNGAKTITVTAMDAAGNSGMGTASVMLDNKLSFTSMIGDGITLFHVPLDDDDFSAIGDLRTVLGDKVNALVAYQEGRLEPSSDNIRITAGLGIIVSLNAAAEITFTGEPWGGGTAVISLEVGDANLIGLPLDIEGIDKISDIKGLDAAIEGVYPNLTDFVAAAGDIGDGDVAGDAAYYVLASAAATITVTGEGWSNSTEMAGAAPIALSGYKVDSQTPVLSVFGSVVDEITGVAKEGFRVKVKNLSTKGAVSEVTSIETADGYSMTLLDLANAHAARVGDVLEISADSPNPLIGVQPVRYTVTVDDVKTSTIQLEDLIAYEIPAETELLRNYPNPFNPETWIPYHLSEDADVNLTIYDVNGEVVRDIDVGHQNAAKYDSRAKAIYWDGRNRFGEQVASGIYFYHLDAGDFSGTRKMVILK